MDRSELLRVATMIYGNREVKGKPVSVVDAVYEAVEIIEEVNKKVAELGGESGD